MKIQVILVFARPGDVLRGAKVVDGRVHLTPRNAGLRSRLPQHSVVNEAVDQHQLQVVTRLTVQVEVEGRILLGARNLQLGHVLPVDRECGRAYGVVRAATSEKRAERRGKGDNHTDQ